MRPVRVEVGLTDSIDTQVSGDELSEGMEVVVGEDTDPRQVAKQPPIRLLRSSSAAAAEAHRDKAAKAPAKGKADKAARAKAKRDRNRFKDAPMELIRIENIHKTYHLGEVDVPVLNGVSFSIRRGEMVA